MFHCHLATFIILLTVVFSPFLTSCSDTDMPAGLSNYKEVKDFLEIASSQDAEPALRYAALEPVISIAREVGEFEWLTSQLARVLEKNPYDPYGAYYLMAMAEDARDIGSEKLALDYLRRLLKNYPDLTIANQSLHLLALGEIARNTQNPHEAIVAREEMQSRFSDRIETGKNQYDLANEYKKIGEWGKMFDSYKAFLNAPNATILNIPEARSNAIDALKFHSSDKSWTMVNLDDLVQTIKYAIKNQDEKLLHRYQSDNFFFMNWSQETSDSFTHIPMNLGSFLTNRVRYRTELDSYSNDREAYLWTAGWTWKIPTWYLYFHRIDYPVNPEINGRWEWTGIYFGERL